MSNPISLEAIIDTVPKLLADRAVRWANDLAIVDGSSRLTFSQLGDQAASVAGALVAQGVLKGDRVAIWAENRYEWIVGALGAQLAGAAIVPLNTRFKSSEVVDVLARSRARVLICTGTFLDQDYPLALDEHLHALPDLTDIYSLSSTESKRARPWIELAGGDPAVGWHRARTVTGKDACDILFTSGTTGRPKGAVCLHAGVVGASTVLTQVVGLGRGDKYLLVNPFFHAFGYKAGWLNCLVAGATAYPHATFGIARALDAIEHERITVFPGPPTLFWSILESDSWHGRDLSSLRMTITGSTGVPPSLLTRLHDDLGFEDICVGYGLTEANGLGTMCRPGDSMEVVSRTNGRPVPGMELRFGGDGEILLRGFIMKGYLDDPTATAEAIDSAGWLHTGDVGELDGDGNLLVLGRKKDIFIVGGFNVYPAELEALIVEHPQVARAAVVGVFDERLGEVGHAFIVPSDGAVFDTTEFHDWCRQRMANFKVPRYVTVRQELPLTANGKVRKDLLQGDASRDSRPQERLTP